MENTYTHSFPGSSKEWRLIYKEQPKQNPNAAEDAEAPDAAPADAGSPERADAAKNQTAQDLEDVRRKLEDEISAAYAELDAEGTDGNPALTEDQKERILKRINNAEQLLKETDTAPAAGSNSEKGELGPLGRVFRFFIPKKPSDSTDSGEDKAEPGAKGVDAPAGETEPGTDVPDEELPPPPASEETPDTPDDGTDQVTPATNTPVAENPQGGTDTPAAESDDTEEPTDVEPSTDTPAAEQSPEQSDTPTSVLPEGAAERAEKGELTEEDIQAIQENYEKADDKTKAIDEIHEALDGKYTVTAKDGKITIEKKTAEQENADKENEEKEKSMLNQIIEVLKQILRELKLIGEDVNSLTTLEHQKKEILDQLKLLRQDPEANQKEITRLEAKLKEVEGKIKDEKEKVDQQQSQDAEYQQQQDQLNAQVEAVHAQVFEIDQSATVQLVPIYPGAHTQQIQVQTASHPLKQELDQFHPEVVFTGNMYAINIGAGRDVNINSTVANGAPGQDVEADSPGVTPAPGTVPAPAPVAPPQQEAPEEELPAPDAEQQPEQEQIIPDLPDDEELQNAWQQQQEEINEKYVKVTIAGNEILVHKQYEAKLNELLQNLPDGVRLENHYVHPDMDIKIFKNGNFVESINVGRWNRMGSFTPLDGAEQKLIDTLERVSSDEPQSLRRKPIDGNPPTGSDAEM